MGALNETMARTGHGPTEGARETHGPGLIAHYAPKSLITDALVYGTPVMALCGYKWVPTRDGMQFPLCRKCEQIFETLR